MRRVPYRAEHGMVRQQSTQRPHSPNASATGAGYAGLLTRCRRRRPGMRADRQAGSALAAQVCLRRPPVPRFRGKHDPRASKRIRAGVMVPKRNAQTPTDIRQPGAGEWPLPARQLHGTDEAPARRAQTVAGTARVQHPPVELGVVGGNEARRGEPALQDRPEFAESGCLPHILPTQAMQPREREPPSGRTDQVAPRLQHMAAAAGRKSDRAGTVVASVRDLEVDRHECVLCVDYHAPFDGRGAQGSR